VYPILADASGVKALTPEACYAQLGRIRAGLRFEAAPPQTARYDIREFVY